MLGARFDRRADPPTGIDHDLVEFLPTHASGGEYEQNSGPQRSARVDALVLRWHGVARMDRALVLSAAAVLTLAGVLTVDAARQHPPARHVIRSVIVDNPVPGVDARGCPTSTSCTVRVATDLAMVVHARVPALTILAASEVVDARTQRIYRRDLLAVDPHDDLSVIRLLAGCVPGGAGNSVALDAVSQTYAKPPGGGFGAPERTRMTPVRDGCFAYASYRATRIAAEVPTGSARLLDLVTDPALAVAP